MTHYWYRYCHCSEVISRSGSPRIVLFFGLWLKVNVNEVVGDSGHVGGFLDIFRREGDKPVLDPEIEGDKETVTCLYRHRN